MHVGAREVALLIPGGGRQHDVAELTGARHPEVDVDEQVELAGRRDVAPGHVLGPLRRRRLLGQQVVEVRAHEVAQEVLVALARAAQQVGAPHEEQAREVARVVGVLH